MPHLRFKNLIFLFLLTACNFRFVPTPTPTPTATLSPAAHLTVTYLQNGTLYLWREGDAQPQMIASQVNPPITIAPDGQHVAFTRGQDGEPQTLWVVSADGTLEQAIAELGDIPAQRSGSARIGDVAWLDASTLYFNSFQSYAWGEQPDNNLYRAEIGVERRPALILPPGAGGEFAISPNGQQIAAVYPGQYNSEQGRVVILDPLGERARTVLEFTAVSTSSEPAYYPPLEWLADSSAVHFSLPTRALRDQAPTAPPVQLWTLPVDGDARIAGYVPASFDGLPRWSDRVGTMLYSAPATSAEPYTLYLAESDGANPQQVSEGGAEILAPQWIAGEDRFVFQRGAVLMLGQRGTTPQMLTADAQQWMITGNSIVYTSSGTLYAQTIDGGSPISIAAVTDPLWMDAVFAP